MKYHAIAENPDGFTFQFFFHNTNWNGIEKVAAETLAEFVAVNPLHAAHGPWVVRSFDVGF